MKAAITPRYGPASILELSELPTPEPGPGQVLIRVHASQVSAGDLRVRAADFPGVSALLGRLMMGIRRPRHPVQGTMFAGRIVAIGSGVTRYHVGQEVFGSVDHGAYAEFLVAEQNGPLAPIPTGRNHSQAAAIPYGAGTALHFLRDLAKLQRGERVLIIGATGGVGRFAVQLARHMGAKITAIGRARHFELMKSLGADQVLDYTQGDFRNLGQKYDLIFDIADASTFRKCRDSLGPKGRYLNLCIHLRLLLQMAWTSIIGGKKALFSVHTGSAESMAEVAALFAQGVFDPVIARQFPLNEVARAHESAQSRNEAGAVIVRVTD